jgi:hypothetical protein
MNWKKFLKPDWRKIVILIIISIIFSLSSAFFACITEYGLYEMKKNSACGLSNVPSLALSSYLYFIPVGGWKETDCFGSGCSGYAFNILFLIGVSIYLLSCLIIWIYDKVKKK